MSYAFLKELRNLSVVVLHPMDEEGIALTDHLRRIGCMPQLVWPVPEQLPKGTNIVLVAIVDDQREALRRLFRNMGNPAPTILAIVSYENPATLQLVLESGAMAVIGRPIKPFGLLTNLAIARNIWTQTQNLARDARRYKRKVKGEQTVSRAKTILMATRNIDEDQAHRELRAEAMSRRIAIEAVAQDIIAGAPAQIAGIAPAGAENFLSDAKESD